MTRRYQVDPFTAIALTTRPPVLDIRRNGLLEVLFYPDSIKIGLEKTTITIDMSELPHPPWGGDGAHIKRIDTAEMAICVVSVFDTPTMSIQYVVRYEQQRQISNGKELEFRVFVEPIGERSGVRITRIE